MCGCYGHRVGCYEWGSGKSGSEFGSEFGGGEDGGDVGGEGEGEDFPGGAGEGDRLQPLNAVWRVISGQAGTIRLIRVRFFVLIFCLNKDEIGLAT